MEAEGRGKIVPFHEGQLSKFLEAEGRGGGGGQKLSVSNNCEKLELPEILQALSEHLDRVVC